MALSGHSYYPNYLQISIRKHRMYLQPYSCNSQHHTKKNLYCLHVDNKGNTVYPLYRLAS